MARTSIAASKAELYDLLISGGLPSPLVAVYDHEPLPGHIQKPAAATISTVGMTPIDYQIALRIYVTADPDGEKAQEDLDDLIMTLDARMDSGFGPSQWEVTYEAELSAFVATCVFQVGREDDAFHR